MIENEVFPSPSIQQLITPVVAKTELPFELWCYPAFLQVLDEPLYALGGRLRSCCDELPRHHVQMYGDHGAREEPRRAQKVRERRVNNGGAFHC